ncbi:probable proline--tRNA ligase, mitochondrial [Coccinella septempunctata]|uniref:probable proline--tRNA ligase, mitochondrial n=1 Tax=Coccinella septempunctata TaxID=41139 RepID=UPI001D07BEBA|nr:probable proline--tRNA ligase, mitochondrial [Coccinella septempunctata]
MQRLSKIFQPYHVIPKEIQTQQKQQNLYSKSAKLMLELGIMRQSSPGCFNLLPLGVRALEKLVKFIDGEMQSIGGQKVEFPTLINQKLWLTSGRIKEVTELFQLKDRHGHSYILGPTHEEIASELVSQCQNSYKNFPLLLYQITQKFRDEIRPKLGLIRSKQFTMKDMYSFDIDQDSAIQAYETVSESYSKIFRSLGIKFHRTRADNGTMGGLFSHEYHYEADIGEDILLKCNKCSDIMNSELVKDQICPKCGELGNMSKTKGIEVGHTFLLGDKYTKPFSCNFTNKEGKVTNLQMGCYGLGITRILAAAIESLSTDEEMRWPRLIAPYSVLIIPPKADSHEDSASKNNLELLYSSLNQIIHLEGEVLVDDRSSMTIGRRHMQAKRCGYPFILVIGKKILENPPLYELHDIGNGVQRDFILEDLIAYMNKSEKVQKVKLKI